MLGLAINLLRFFGLCRLKPCTAYVVLSNPLKNVSEEEMMSDGAGFQSYEDAYKSYLAQFSSGMPVFENALKGMTRIQLELMGLANRRVQAVLEVPSRLAQCRTPHDFGEEHVRFWRLAGEQYLESGERFMAAWQQMMAPVSYGWSGQNGSGSANDTRGRAKIRLVKSSDREVGFGGSGSGQHVRSRVH